MKKTLKAVLAALLVVCLLLPLAACGNNATTETKLKIAIPNDTTNEARALLLLQDQGYIKLKDGAGITATILDIVETVDQVCDRGLSGTGRSVDCDCITHIFSSFPGIFRFFIILSFYHKTGILVPPGLWDGP